MEFDLKKLEKVDELEAKLLELPQIDAKVYNHFGPGLYVRELHIPAGSFIIGHSHKSEQLNILLSGECILLPPGGESIRLKAPYMFNGKPGRKMAYAITDVIWQNIHATDETDLDKLEDMLIEKSEAYLKYEELKAIKELEI